MKKYIIYLDILGFKNLPEEMERKSGFYEEWIRQNCLLNPLKSKIDNMKQEGIRVFNKKNKIKGFDDYLLIVDDIQMVFEIIGEFTRIEIPHKNYDYIPFEIAVGTQETNEIIDIDPISIKSTINFLKNDIIKSYKNENKDKSIKKTFVVFTQEFFKELDPLDKKYCKEISFDGKIFFSIYLKKIWQRCKVFEFLKKNWI
ncbi:MAG: hypothetical protein HF967_00715 [Methanosarcinales archaeon]|nr:hypothetical protein [Methanosarcinales archaeon]